MRYFINSDLHALAKAEEKPSPIKRNLRYGKSVSEWTEISEEQYHEFFEIFYEEALTV